MSGNTEQAVIVRAALPIGGPDVVFDQLDALENQLVGVINAAQVGEFDGNEIGKEDIILYMYGPDAEKLFSAVEPLLRRALLTRRAIVTVRQGPFGSASRQFVLGS